MSEKIHLTRMSPASSGCFRGHLSGLANYVGGRLHGRITMTGYHDIVRDESGNNLDGRQIPANYYRLYANGILLHYIHSSLITGDEGVNDRQ
jgi:hypothetical protein